MAGTVVADVFQSSITGTPPQFNDGTSTQIGTLCRAWVNFNGTSTVAIRASFNVTSITDNGTGDYTVNFTTAMPDANYAPAFAGGVSGENWGLHLRSTTLPTASAYRFVNVNTGTTVTDVSFICVSFFR